MIYAIVGTEKTIRDKAYKELEKLGTVTAHIYSEQISALEPLVSATSLFGDKVIANLIQVMDVASSESELVRLLPEMKVSENIFIIDEPFADANRIKKLSTHVEKIFDGREEKDLRTNLFTLCDLFAKRDKKNAWIEWMNIRDKESGEAIQGLMWWKFQTIWAGVRDGKPSKFTLSECEVIGKKLVRSSILAHRGERDLKTELEEIILSL
jgi:hypothetical protein